MALLCCEALGLDGAAYARGYLQHWLRDDELTERMAKRIMTTAHRILAAGDQEEAPPRSSLAPRFGNQDFVVR